MEMHFKTRLAAINEYLNPVLTKLGMKAKMSPSLGGGLLISFVKEDGSAFSPIELVLVAGKPGKPETWNNDTMILGWFDVYRLGKWRGIVHHYDEGVDLSGSTETVMRKVAWQIKNDYLIPHWTRSDVTANKTLIDAFEGLKEWMPQSYRFRVERRDEVEGISWSEGSARMWLALSPAPSEMRCDYQMSLYRNGVEVFTEATGDDGDYVASRVAEERENRLDL